MDSSTREASFLAEAAAVPQARRLTREFLQDQQLDAFVDGAQLIVSELVGNVVLHVGGEVGVRLTTAEDRLVIEVTDRSTVTPAMRMLSASASTGRGMRLVHSLSARHGVRVHDTGKTVWVTMTTASTQQDDDVLADHFAQVDWVNAVEGEDDLELASDGPRVLAFPDVVALALAA